MRDVIESFQLDHTKVRAPYVRIASSRQKDGVFVTKADIRICQPNKMAITTGSLHTMEHILATELKTTLSDLYIDLSPMGCRTGFYLIVFGDVTASMLASYVYAAMKRLLQYNLEDVPGLDPASCGNYLDHDLLGAQQWASRWLKGIDKKGVSAF